MITAKGTITVFSLDELEDMLDWQYGNHDLVVEVEDQDKEGLAVDIASYLLTAARRSACCRDV